MSQEKKKIAAASSKFYHWTEIAKLNWDQVE